MPPIVYADAYRIDIGPHIFPTTKYRLVRDALSRPAWRRPATSSNPRPPPGTTWRWSTRRGYLGKLRDGRLSPEEIARLEMAWSRGHGRWVPTDGRRHAARGAARARAAAAAGRRGGRRHGSDRLMVAIAPGRRIPPRLRGPRRGLLSLQRRRRDDPAASGRPGDRPRGDRRRRCAPRQRDAPRCSAPTRPSSPTRSTRRHNYPARKPPGTLDRGLRDGVGDDEYLATMRRRPARASSASVPTWSTTSPAPTRTRTTSWAGCA